MIFMENSFKDERSLKAAIGMTEEAFNALLPAFSEAWDEYIEEKRKNYTGLKRYAPRNTHKLKTSKLKLFFLLFTLKTNPTFDLLAMSFGVHRSRTHRWFHELLPILKNASNKKDVLPEREIDSDQEFLKKFSNNKDILIDGTERPIQRPKNKEDRREKYSGKKNGILKKIL